VPQNEELPKSLQPFNNNIILTSEVLASQLDAGEHKINIDASNVSSGIYFYRITVGEFTSVKKMQYIK
jgi:hypothetical protein